MIHPDPSRRVSGSGGRQSKDLKPPKKVEPKTKIVFGTSFANYHFDRSEKDTSDQ